MSLPALALTVALLGQFPLSTRAELPTGEIVELAADQLLYEPSKQVLTAKGNTVLSTDRLTLRADEVIYDESAQRATARGNVMLVSGTFAAVAEEITVDMKSFEATVRGGLFMQKKNVSEEALLAARTPDELRKLGETVITLTGTHIKRVGPEQFTVDGLAFTPCDCNPSEPSWRVEASRADVKMGERAILTWPVVYIQSVPVFALPWLYLPLAERRSGILVPKPNFAGIYGFALEQPVFLTLGRSYDLTFTPGYYFGQRRDAGGIQGPRLLNEFRYVPSERTRGRVSVGLLYDLKPLRDPFTDGRSLESELPGTRRGLRGEASLQHTQELGNGFHDKLDFSFVSDGFYPRDVTADVVARENQFLRSTGVLYHRSEDRWTGVDVAIRQDLRFGTNVLGTTRTFEGDVLGPNTIQRFPAITLALPERPLVGRIHGGLRLEYTRLAPVLGQTGDEGVDGVYEAADKRPGTPDFEVTQGNRRFDGPLPGFPGEREARDRLDFVPRASASFSLGPLVRATPSLAYRQNVWFGEITRNTFQRGYPIAGLVLESELARTYGSQKAPFRHSLVPVVELRSIPFVFGEAPAPYDEIDRAIPTTATLTGSDSGGHLQGTLELRQKLFQRGEDQNIRELISLTVGQGFELLSPESSTPRVAETYARLGAASGTFRTNAALRLDPHSLLVTQLSAGMAIDDARGTALYAQYDNLLLQGSDRLRRGVDLLVGPAVDPLLTDSAQQVTAGIRIATGLGVGLRYEAIVLPNAPPDSRLRQQVVGVSYGPACDCWRLEGQAILRPGIRIPDFGVNLTIAGFGSFGA